MRLRVVGEIMKPQGTQSLLGNILVVLGGTAKRQGPLLADGFLLLVCNRTLYGEV